jgi:hypothetical protein
MLGDMLGVTVTSQRTLIQLWQVAQGLPSLNPLIVGFSLVVVVSSQIKSKLLQLMLHIYAPEVSLKRENIRQTALLRLLLR